MGKIAIARLWQFTVWMVMFNCPIFCQAAERYAAMFSDGTRAEEAEVREWCEPASPAKIGGRILFDPSTPIRWIIDRTQPPVAVPSNYVEFVGGDRLAGEVVSSNDGRTNPYHVLPLHLIVKPTLDAQPPDVFNASDLRVSLESVKRIVWEHVAPDEYRPGTAWMKTGKSLAFRSLRWSGTAITILTNEGVREIPLTDLGEIHMPIVNPWNAYLEQLAILSPDCNSRMIQIDGNDGSRWTTSVERFQARHYGDRNRPEQWYQLVQPAWSLDSIWLRYRTIRSWRFFAPHEVPLSNFEPVRAKHASVFGSVWDWQVDMNVRHGPLQSTDQDFGWGFGVAGTSELTFDLPVTARAFRTKYGLDRTSGTGGCVDVEVLDGTGKSIARQVNLIGASIVGDVQWVDTPDGPPESRRITLRTEMAHESRPAGADPFDIRDVVNWYEPEIRLDRDALLAQIRTRGISQLNGLIGWTLSTSNPERMNVANVIDAFDTRDPQFRRVVRSSDRFYILSRKAVIGSRDRWMALVASRFAENTSSTTMQVRIDGRVYGEFDVPIRNSMADPEPMLVPIAQFQGKTVTVEVVVYPTDEKSWVDWRGFSVGPDRPGLLTLFEDDEKFPSLLNRGTGRAESDAEKPYSGIRSLKVIARGVNNASLPGIDAQICESPFLGQYRYVVFAWKKSTGSRIQLQFANRGRLTEDGPLLAADRNQAVRRGMRRTQIIDERGLRYGYCYEQGAVTTQLPVPLWFQGDLPREWQLIQRDLFNDFGHFLVTGLSLNCVDGDAAWFDHIYLARTHEDLQYAATLLVNPQPAPPKPDGNGNLWIARRDDYPVEFSRIAPLFSSIDMPHGLIRMAEQNGQLDVLRTHANDQNKPLILRAGVVIPPNRRMMLDMHLSHHPQCDWQLVVRANGEVLTDILINEGLTTPQRGWATVQVDLSKFAGQNVMLEVLNQSNNWSNEIAYWKRIELIDQ